MTNLQKYYLKDITAKIGSGATPTGGSNAYHDVGISLIRSQNVLDLKFEYDGLAFIDEEQAEGLKNVVVENNDILLNITGDSVARVCKPPKNVLPARVNQHVSIIRTNEKADSDFMLYKLFSIKEHLLSISEIGATRRAITKGMLEELELALPDIKQQKKIASILKNFDDKIDLLHRQNKTLEQLIDTLFKQAFVDYSNDFKKGVLGTFVETTIGGEWGKENPEGDFTFQVQCIRGTDIADLQTGLATRIPTRFVKEKKYNSIEPVEGDLIIEISGGSDDQSTGRTIYINDQVKQLFDSPLVFSNFCRLIRCKKKEYMFYLYSYIQMLYKQGDFFNLENGSSGIRNFDYKAFLFELEYDIHNTAAILKFNSLVQPYFEKINQNKKQIRLLTHYRDMLLPKLLNGEVKLKLN